MLQNLKAASLKLVQLCGSYLYGRLSRDVQAGVFHCAVDGGCRLLLRPCVVILAAAATPAAAAHHTCEFEAHQGFQGAGDAC